eukprot:gene9437-6620_t
MCVICLASPLGVHRYSCCTFSIFLVQRVPFIYFLSLSGTPSEWFLKVHSTPMLPQIRKTKQNKTKQKGILTKKDRNNKNSKR